jgi:hypothetical protein
VENALRRRPDIEYESDPTDITLNAATVSLPTDCKSLKSLYFDDGTRSGEIDVTSPQELANWKRDIYGVTAGVPQKAAIISNGSKLALVPTPDTSYTAKIVYVVKLTRLAGGSNSATNWVLTDHSDIYLFGSLLEATPFLKNDERIPVWESKFEKAMAEMTAFLWNRQFSANTLKPRIRPID